MNRRQALKAAVAIPLSTAVNNSVQNHRAIAIPNSLFTPKFGIGQTVRHSWICNDDADAENFGKELWMVGIVHGLILWHPRWQQYINHKAKGWIYYIHFFKQSERLGEIECDWFDSCSEAELENFGQY